MTTGQNGFGSSLTRRTALLAWYREHVGGGDAGRGGQRFGFAAIQPQLLFDGLHARQYAAAIVAGFLLTAVQTWTGRPGLSGTPLAALAAIWLAAALLSIALFPAVRWFSALKARRRDIAWLKYL